MYIAHASEDSGPTWSVKFDGDAAAPLIIDAGSGMYDQQVEEQMAAAAAQVRTSPLASTPLAVLSFELRVAFTH